MNHRATLIIVSSCFILTVFPAQRANAQGMSPSSPAPVKASVNSQIQCGANPVSLEPYDLKLTVLQVVRGKEAWDRLQSASTSNAPAKAGFDYVLALLRFELNAKVSPGNKSFQLVQPMQLVAMSADGKEYENVPVVLPKPELTGALKSGNPVEGWFAFQVEQKDRKPLMAFDPSSGGATLRGKVLWFQLY